VPELPEVETTRRGIDPHVSGATVREVIVRRPDLRQPVSDSLESIVGAKILGVRRRSKYLLVDLGDRGTVLIHLGMSGSLRVVAPDAGWKPHDHIGISLSGGMQLRFHDPRRFGLFLHLPEGDPLDHPLLRSLGPEPLESDFTVAGLLKACAGRQIPIKQVLMDAKVVVGVGNIYASEALFRAGIFPGTSAAKLTRPRAVRLVAAVKSVLEESIREGGTTLRDFLHSSGEPGYFAQRLFVYHRAGQPCRICGAEIRQQTMGQRSTFWCGKCQR
jgi:formamidopyrimidine-DNA glycosylase